MIQVRYNNADCLEISGHAGAGKEGRDLICAAATGLALGLMANSEKKVWEKGYARLEGGCRDIFAAYYLGFLTLQYMYPKYVQCRYDRKLQKNEEEKTWKKN